jgi:predicted HicB family RNase H-like nuclease
MDREKLTVRIVLDIKTRLQEEAEKNGRSLNAEIVQRLRVSLEGYTR